MDILKSNSKRIRMVLLSIFIFLCGITFYIGLNKFIAIVITAVLLGCYIFLLENPKKYDSFQTK